MNSGNDGKNSFTDAGAKHSRKKLFKIVVAGRGGGRRARGRDPFLIERSFRRSFLFFIFRFGRTQLFYRILQQYLRGVAWHSHVARNTDRASAHRRQVRRRFQRDEIAGSRVRAPIRMSSVPRFSTTSPGKTAIIRDPRCADVGLLSKRGFRTSAAVIAALRPPRQVFRSFSNRQWRGVGMSRA